MIETLVQVISGFIFGLLGGPAICFLVSIMIYKLREKREDDELRGITEMHGERIKAIMILHQKEQRRYQELQDKLIKMIDKKTVEEVKE